MVKKSNSSFHFYVDCFGPELFAGWALPKDPNNAPAEITLCADGEILAITNADRPRQDVMKAGFYSSLCGFEFHVSPRLLSETKEWELRAGGESLCKKTISEIRDEPGKEARDNYHYNLERKSVICVQGWAMRSERNSPPVEVTILVNGEPELSVLANGARKDVADRGFWSANCGFSVKLDGVISADCPETLAIQFNETLMETISPAQGEIVGAVELIGERFIMGWAQDLAEPDRTLTIQFIHMETGYSYPVNYGLDVGVFIPEIPRDKSHSGYVVDLYTIDKPGKYKLTILEKPELFSDLELDLIFPSTENAETFWNGIRV